MFRTASTGIAAFLLVLAAAGPAAAHGEKVRTDPPDGAGVKTAPGRVSVTLSEAPTPQAKLQLTDGCGRQVARSVAVRGADIVASVSNAQPGRWRASFRAISSVDGHESEGSWTFRVAGDRDCSQDDTSGDDVPEDNDETEAGGDTAPLTRSTESGFPVVPVAIGAAILLLAAFLVRRSTA